MLPGCCVWFDSWEQTQYKEDRCVFEWTLLTLLVTIGMILIQTEQQTNEKMIVGPELKDEMMDLVTPCDTRLKWRRHKEVWGSLPEDQQEVRLPPSLLLFVCPSVRLFCRHKDGEMTFPLSPLLLGNDGSAVTTLIQVHPLTPHSSPPFRFLVIHSWNNLSHTHTHTRKHRHIISHTSHTFCSHTCIFKISHHKKREAETTATWQYSNPDSPASYCWVREREKKKEKSHMKWKPWSSSSHKVMTLPGTRSHDSKSQWHHLSQTKFWPLEEECDWPHPLLT